ncbi:MAG: diphthine--ammonia ligase [Dehalococcoidales bacterium]|nr:diphthine--ammonia ligase [Dehalococcoidales bacterium]
MSVIKSKAAFVSWSGGKDSCLAAYRAQKSELEIRCLLNMATEDGRHSRSHGLTDTVLQQQAQAMGVRLVQRPAAWDGYEAEFIKMLQTFRQEGITEGIFGDIDFNAHREWIERICEKSGISFHLPLWLNDQTQIMRELIALGFEAIVVATNADVLGKEWLGRKIDNQFLHDLSGMGKSITPCGEAGEYHTLVVNGPLFKKRLEVTQSEKILRDKHWFLEIRTAELRDK